MVCHVIWGVCVCGVSCDLGSVCGVSCDLGSVCVVCHVIWGVCVWCVV